MAGCEWWLVVVCVGRWVLGRLGVVCVAVCWGLGCRGGLGWGGLWLWGCELLYWLVVVKRVELIRFGGGRDLGYWGDEQTRYH